MNLRVVAAITRKDVVDSIRHRYLLTALITPLLVALLFRILLPDVNSRSVLTLVIHGANNSKLISELRNSSQISIVEVSAADAIVTEVKNRKAIGGLVVPANFDDDINAGKQPELTVYVNNQKSSFEQSAFRRLVRDRVQSLVKQPDPVLLVWLDVDKETGEQPLDVSRLDRLLLPLLLIMTFGMTGSLVVPLLLVEEKEKRTLDFLLASPASLKEIIAGKALTGAVYGLLIAGLLLGINRQLIANWRLTIVSMLLGLIFVVAIGLVVGSLLNNTMQVNTWASFVLILLMAPSFPSIGLTGMVDTAMRFIPTYYLSEALKLSLAGGAPSKIWINLAILLGCTVVAFFAAAWALRRQSRN